MALSIFTTVRRWRFLDSVIETVLGTGLVLSPFVLAGLAVTATWYAGRGLGAARVLTMLLVAVVVVPLSLLFFGRAERWIRRVAHQPGLSRGTVAVGADGVRITGLFLQRFVPWDAIEGVGNARDKLMVVIRLRDGGTLRFRVSPADCTAWGVGREILRRRDEALERNPASPLRALRDANADLGRWVARVRDVALGGYRQEVATPDVLIRVAEDPSAAPEQRVGAALALAKAPEAIRARVHVAAKSTARPLLAEAMVEAVEGEVDVDRLKRVLG